MTLCHGYTYSVCRQETFPFEISPSIPRRGNISFDIHRVNMYQVVCYTRLSVCRCITLCEILPIWYDKEDLFDFPSRITYEIEETSILLSSGISINFLYL